MTEDWVSITEAAGRLGMDRSTLSRYVKQHAEVLPVRYQGKFGLIDYVALVAHRGENIRLPQGPVHVPTQAKAGRRFEGSQADAAARDKLAVAEMREMDLAERRGTLTPVSEVDAAGRNAVVLMQSAFERAIERRAAEIALRYSWDEKQVRVALKSLVGDGMEEFNRQVLGYLDDLKRRQDAAPAGGARDGEGSALQ